MGLFLALALTAAPASCEQLWTRVWAALSEREFKGGPPPVADALPDWPARLQRAWIAECGRFDVPTLDCARGVTLERELLALRRQLEQAKVPPVEIERAVARLRAEWRILDCRQVDRSIDRAARVMAEEAGLEKPRAP